MTELRHDVPTRVNLSWVTLMGWPCGVAAFIGIWLGFGTFDKFFWLFAGIFA